MEQEMAQRSLLIRQRLKTPRAAAIAGILFSVLLSTTLILLRLSVRTPAQEAQAWMVSNPDSVVLALNLVPFAGIAFLWFIGVVRDRLGAYEDRFFATVFLGSGLLFLAMFFTAAAVAGATIIVFDAAPNPISESGTYVFGRAVTARIMNVYALKMAAVFMFSTATIAIRTQILPLWISILGYALAVSLLLTSHFVDWLGLAFPLWVFILSAHLLIENLRRPSADAGANQMEERI